jgi:hypothetical protein
MLCCRLDLTCVFRAIDGLDGVYCDIHKATYAATGWVGMSIFGGPNPRMGGNLTLKM